MRDLRSDDRMLLMSTTSELCYHKRDSHNQHYDACPLGHTKIESTVRDLGVDIEDALVLADGTEV